MTEQVKLNAVISALQFGKRLDQALAQLFPQYSRSHLKKWIKNRYITVNGEIIDKAKHRVSCSGNVSINAYREEESYRKASNIPLNIIYEDDDILLINKPKRLVVHPGAGHTHDTLLNALLYYVPTIASVPRAGIVHRLDKDTTGLMVIGKTIPAYTNLVFALKNRIIIREYEAIVIGCMNANGKVDAPISRHIIKRTCMAVHPIGKPAITHYYIIRKFRSHTWVRLRLETGRTHQIRVHMSYIYHPVVGDPLYSGRRHFPKNASEKFITILRTFDRQALHATMLRLHHPISGLLMEWHVPLPEDIMSLIHAMQIDIDSFNY
ncbi:23S rRNA pseudouridine(1911/1915/1917) synthase RluD [Candidatus Erwinia haradaeae]|uniref:Pseudouridine synthase n=1 Tax=Candidatus Erwinia haradaeae TaxID=1922217 RepID=A0A451D2G0_9GAMM|nr:23S rRNA pseudouridine(1911/1915/1917) synthase RluD [Candidatus Erwinia haradaeae]VFP79813.1 Ribosomal large subunit pseudouridine synthase D [Candidatus Erwinia haradaeae]